ncbi:MAG: radical SAM protein, partial [Candidatus Zixiibacteriota bacterium]
GLSLGINILPAGYKACPFNCRYCQYGFTDKRGYLAESDGCGMPSIDRIADAVSRALTQFPSVSYITFSGNGEPTLHPEFGAIVREIKKLRDILLPHARVAILSNSALVHKECVRIALAELDDRFMKLDAGHEQTFRQYNRPHKDVTFDAVVDGLKKLDRIAIQALFTGGKSGNGSDEAIDFWIRAIGEIKPIACHIYSIDRFAPDKQLTLLDKDELIAIKSLAERRTGIPVGVF